MSSPDPTPSRLALIQAVRQVGLVGVGVVAGMTLGRWWLVAPTVPEVVTPDPDTQELRAEIDSLRGDLRELHEQRRAIAAADGGVGMISIPVVVAGHPAEPPVQYTPEELEALSEADGAARGLAVEHALESEPRSPAREARVGAALDTFTPTEGHERPRIVATRCTDRICRIEVAHHDPGSAREMLISLSGLVGLNGNGLMLRDQSADGFVTTYYVSQDERRLPRPEPL